MVNNGKLEEAAAEYAEAARLSPRSELARERLGDALYDLGKRIFDGPWDTSFDFTFLKRTRITERHSLDLRMDVRNFFNHPNFSIGDQTVTSTTFGKITSTVTGARVFQFSMQYRF